MVERIDNRINTVIWDLDGTLLDSFGIFVDVLNEIAPRHGFEVPTPDVMLANYHGSLEESISAVLGGVGTNPLKRIISDFLSIQDTQYEVIEGHLFKDAEDLAKRLHEAGKRQVLVTNRDHEGRNNASPRSIVEKSELRHYIDAVICGDDGEHRKPKPEVLGPLLNGHIPENTVVIGDQFVDALLAHNLGSRAILVGRSGEVPLYLDSLEHDWESHVNVVTSLSLVEVQ